MGMRDTKQLIKGKCSKHKNGHGICPKTVHPERDHNYDFCEPMRQQIHRCESGIGVRESTQMAMFEVTRISEMPVGPQSERKVAKRPWIHKQQDADDGFQNSVDALECDPDA